MTIAIYVRKDLFGLTVLKGLKFIMVGICGSRQQTWQKGIADSSHLQPQAGSRERAH